jgi:hypothetical protein
MLQLFSKAEDDELEVSIIQYIISYNTMSSAVATKPESKSPYQLDITQVCAHDVPQ